MVNRRQCFLAACALAIFTVTAGAADQRGFVSLTGNDGREHWL
jgi:hypothetical protein